MRALSLGALSDEDRKRLQTSMKSDMLFVRCVDCGFGFNILFHLSAKHENIFGKLRKIVSGNEEWRGGEICLTGLKDPTEKK
jgi:hypothetical protein